MPAIRTYLPVNGMKRVFPQAGGMVIGPAALALQVVLTPFVLLHISPRTDAICAIATIAGLAMLVYSMRGGIMWPGRKRDAGIA